MKILKNILIAAVVIIFIAGVGIYFLPNHYSVSRTIEINKPADVVYAQLNDYNKWGAWDPWIEKDPESKATFEGVIGQPGHKMSWNGKKLGIGNMTIVTAEPNKSINSNVEFIQPFQMSCKDRLELEPNGNTTKVTWTNSGGLKYPVGRLFGLTIDRMLGADYQHGLDKLKKVCEDLPEPVASMDTTTATKSM